MGAWTRVTVTVARPLLPWGSFPSAVKRRAGARQAPNCGRSRIYDEMIECSLSFRLALISSLQLTGRNILCLGPCTHLPHLKDLCRESRVDTEPRAGPLKVDGTGSPL